MSSKTSSATSRAIAQLKADTFFENLNLEIDEQTQLFGKAALAKDQTLQLQNGNPYTDPSSNLPSQQQLDEYLNQPIADPTKPPEVSPTEENKPIAGMLRTLLQGLKGTAKRTRDIGSGLPIPGDIGLPFVILVLLFMVIIPVVGLNATHTRMNWLWLSFTANAAVTDSITNGWFQPSATNIDSNSVGSANNNNLFVPLNTFQNYSSILSSMSEF